jgi:uncharacterized membrane protein YccF (DUF307 family)
MFLVRTNLCNRMPDVAPSGLGAAECCVRIEASLTLIECDNVVNDWFAIRRIVWRIIIGSWLALGFPVTTGAQPRLTVSQVFAR